MSIDLTPESWAATVLKRLGIHQTPGAVQALTGWAKAEGGHWNNTARYNPLNTTQSMPGYSKTGTQGNIGSYKDWGQGIDATVRTLRNGRYTGIISALQSGDPGKVATAIGSSPWGTNPSLIQRAIAGTQYRKGVNAVDLPQGFAGATPTPGAGGIPTPSAAAAGSGGNDRLALVASVMKRLEAATPNIPYNSPLSRTDDVQQPQGVGTPGSISNLNLGQYQSTFKPTSIGDMLAQIASRRSGDATSAPGIPATGGAEAPAPKEKGVADFEGTKVAGWIAPALQYAREHGWKGQVNSGYRSFADQTRIYNSGVRPAAKPGTSNHEGTEFPRGAVDVSDPEILSEILKKSKYATMLQWAGSRDPVHFSHPHGGSY